MNEDKPVVRLYDDHAQAFGIPFDGGSGIAHNENYPLKAIIFVERGEKNSVRIPKSQEIIFVLLSTLQGYCLQGFWSIQTV